ncbi:hypothetical protein D1P53_003841 [Cryptococcus gattii VGV]|nr:hypothetical protein D1P53_003841 [Cryptococcus gattii VGV]
MHSNLSRLPRPAHTQTSHPTVLGPKKTVSTKSSIPSFTRTNNPNPHKIDYSLNKSNGKHVSLQIHAYAKRFHLANVDHARSTPDTPTRVPSHAFLISQTCTPTPFCVPHLPVETPKLPNISRNTLLSHSPNDEELLKDLELTFVDDDDAGEEHFTTGKKEQGSHRSDTRNYQTAVTAEHKSVCHYQLPRCTPPSSSHLRKSLVESKRQLDIIRMQRNVLDSRIQKLEREAMKSAWTEVVRMASVEVEEVCKAKELLLQLKSDIDSEDYDPYTC